MSFLKNLGKINDAFTSVVVDSAETANIVVSRGKEKAMHSAMTGRMEDIAEFKQMQEESSITAEDMNAYAQAMQLGCIITQGDKDG